MRAIFNTYPMAFAFPGGGERQLLDIYAEMPKHGVQSMLFDLWQPRLDEVDIVHFFSVIEGSRPFCEFVKNNGIPLIVSPNIWIDESSISEYPVAEIKRQLEFADAIVVNSSIEANNMIRIIGIPECKVHVVHAGIPISFLEEADPSLAKTTLGISERFVLCVGSLHPQKNQLSLIRAMKNFPDIKLVIFGHIRDKSYADRCFDEGGEQVMYAGTIPHSAQLLKSAMAACDVFVLPSFVESPSLASLEAAGQGAQLVLTRIGSEEEYFGNLAHYIDPNSVEDISRALESAMLKSSSGKELKDLVAYKYTVHSTCKALVKIYNEVLRAINE